MDAERARAYLLTLPHVVETAQWGGLVFWVGDKAIGGKMFVLLNLEPDAQGVISYAATQERFHELVEQDGLKPAPYFARIFWIAAEHWNAHRNLQWKEELSAARDLVYSKLPPKVRATLDLPDREQKKAIAEGRKKTADWEAKQLIVKAAKKAARRQR
jgi:predicted DNA-binding protein (MmcQ/YjbR family)